eukprot:363399-Chlamydomonas_euryale.AAC.4
MPNVRRPWSAQRRGGSVAPRPNHLYQKAAVGPPGFKGMVRHTGHCGVCGACCHTHAAVHAATHMPREPFTARLRATFKPAACAALQQYLVRLRLWYCGLKIVVLQTEIEVYLWLDCDMTVT